VCEKPVATNMGDGGGLLPHSQIKAERLANVWASITSDLIPRYSPLPNGVFDSWLW